NAGWAQEISLDLDMVSAICPNCNILLVEATSNGFADLGASVNTAAMLGATAISNSYGGSEWSGETGYWESFYNHPGIAVTASAGDNGYGVEFPAATGYAIAVGGTTLNQATNTGTRNATETVWSGSGSGCSAYEPKPTWQRDSGCAQRTVADVAAVADPATGVWVYDSVPSAGQSGWLVFGGTSVASPIVSSIFALAANTSVQAASGIYAASGGSLFDIISGSNGTCGGSYLCTGETGYDGPTGNGTPNNTTAFTSAAAPTPTSTPVTVATSTPTPLPTSTPTSLPTSTPTSTPISTPTATATPTQTPQSTYSTSATTSPTSVPRGSRVSVTTSVASANASSVLVDVEIYDPSGARVYQKWWNNQSFSAGQTRSFTTSWSVPTSAATGGYTVKVGIYRNGWGTLYNWNNAAALFSVT
ncbi:MAG TPA: hypothetical protein VF937_03090, partial [Chloroflexota bacterium]